MKQTVSYCTYKNYLAKYDPETFTLTLRHVPSGAEAVLTVDGLFLNGEKAISMDEYTACDVGQTFDVEHPERKMSLTFRTDRTDKDYPTFQIFLTASGKQLRMQIYELQQYEIRLSGTLTNGSSADCIAINAKDTATEAIRCAIGPAVARYDNAVYNKITDSALCLEGCRDMAMRYDWAQQQYRVTLATTTEGIAEIILLRYKEHVLADRYEIDFAPLKPRGRYTAPPAGWMTWYAVKFGACEEKVLENTRFQQEHLKDFGADTIWVDWEWCHKKYEKERFDGVNNFNPDPVKYPHGLGYVAEKIKECGFVPALWLGFTNDPSITDYEEAHPEISLAHWETWSGKYYYDVTHPEYLNGFLPRAVQQVKDWGYEAIKYDTLPNCIYAHERFHGNMQNPDVTTYEAFRGMIQKTRQLLGEDFYMLSCGSYISSILWSAGIFDAARVGPDLFTWEKFVYTLDRLRYYYPLHNIALITDPDNVVLRDEYSTFAQAVTRLCTVSLLGLPLTFGDDLPKLPMERVELLKRALPVLPIHPTDFNQAVCDGKTQIICLNIAQPFEEYLVTGVSNLIGEEVLRDLSFRETLRLDDGAYLVYDYFGKQFLGLQRDSMQLRIAPYDTRVLAFRKYTGRPQIVSTSRHLTQGAAELRALCWEEDTLRFTAELVHDDPYTVTVYVPDGFALAECDRGQVRTDGKLLELTFTPEENGICNFALRFRKTEN